MDKVFVLFGAFLVLLHSVSRISGGGGKAGSSEHSPYEHTHVLDRDGKYVLEWRMDWKTNWIYFNVTVETQGYVGFGLSRKGKMAGADMVIGGVLPNGQPYFKDYYAIGSQMPMVDDSQDWILDTAWESKTHTFLSFSRKFETCDEDHDLPINTDGLALIWSYGERDKIEYHYQHRGTFDTHLLDPDLTPKEINELHYRNATTPMHVDSLGDWKVWRVQFSQEIPPQDTTYYCSLHKAPSHPRKQHVVGVRTVLNSEVERRHIHHFVVHICYAPEGVDPDELFGRNLGRTEECYISLYPYNALPTQYCFEMRHEWSVGARPIFFPEHVGIPFTESTKEYYLFQVHYDNPQRLHNLKLNFALEIFYTERLRKNDGGMFAVGTLLQTAGAPLVTIPPSSLNHVLYGHCAAECTRKMLPAKGMNIFLAKSHTHLAGRGTRFLQVRDGIETGVLIDDNYNFDYQAYRTLHKEVKVLPGDMLGHRCTYETTDRDGNATVRGYSTRNEMCHVFIWYYPYLRDTGSYAVCSSEIRSKVYREFLQINSTIWSDERRVDIVTSPTKNAGLTTLEAANRIHWTVEKRNELQRLHLDIPQVSNCMSVDPNTVEEYLQVEYENQRDATDDTRGFETPDGPIHHPAWEFVSSWPKNIIPYKKPTQCGK